MRKHSFFTYDEHSSIPLIILGIGVVVGLILFGLLLKVIGWVWCVVLEPTVVQKLILILLAVILIMKIKDKENKI